MNTRRKELKKVQNEKEFRFQGASLQSWKQKEEKPFNKEQDPMKDPRIMLRMNIRPV